MSAARAIGSVITLITNSQIRYEGTLGQIDSHGNTVSLTNVRIFGTEGRARENNQQEVPAAEQLFEQIVFRGSDIKELTVFEGTNTAIADPAVVTAFPARNTNIKSSPNPQHYTSSTANANVQHSQQHQQQNRHHQQQQQRYGGGGGGYRRGGHSGGNRVTSYRNTRRVDSHTGQDFSPASEDVKEKFKDDFDFLKSLEEFEKKKSEFEKAREDTKNHSKAYDRKSFFDKISCDQQDRTQRPDREGMKRADAETFGSEMVGNMRGPRRGRGGRGRYNGRYH